MEKTLKIKTREQVETINRLAYNSPYEMWLKTNTAVLNAQSLLALFSLLGKEVRFEINDNINEQEFEKIIEKIS